MMKCTKTNAERDGVHQYPKRFESQATLSAIGDVSVAATEAVGRVAAAPRRRWLALYAFLLLVYVVGSAVAVYTYVSAPWVQMFVAPLPLVLIAALVFWRCQVWKRRAQDWRFREKVRQDALNSLAHEAASSLNAIRANLTGIEDANSVSAALEHLKLVERSLSRISVALEKKVGLAPPVPATAAKPSPETRRAMAA